MPVFCGYSFAVSDIRVTLRDGSERDCLQKIYPIANSIALGFAGSVRIGFTMVAAMKQWLRCDDPMRAWFPLETIQMWPEIARDVFSAAPTSDQAGHCHLIMLSTDPQAMNGPWPITHAHIFRSPSFDPVEIGRNKVAGIGSGNFIDKYKTSLHELSENHEQNFSMMQMETNNPGGMGTGLGFRITRLIQDTNPSGISSHLHYCWVYPGKTIIKTNNHVSIGAWTGFESGSGINQSVELPNTSMLDKSQTIPRGSHFEMPKIAQSWEELQQMLQQGGADAEGVVA